MGQSGAEREDGQVILRGEDIHSWYLDPDIVFKNGPDDPSAAEKENRMPLLVNPVNTWGLRPEAHTRIPILFLASDYVRTNTDLATMEGANEAARRSVNAIIEAFWSRATKCKIGELRESGLLPFWRKCDAARFAMGLPWSAKPAGAFSGRFIHHQVLHQLLRLRLWLRRWRLGI